MASVAQDVPTSGLILVAKTHEAYYVQGLAGSATVHCHLSLQPFGPQDLQLQVAAGQVVAWWQKGITGVSSPVRCLAPDIIPCVALRHESMLLGRTVVS